MGIIWQHGRFRAATEAHRNVCISAMDAGKPVDIASASWTNASRRTIDRWVAHVGRNISANTRMSLAAAKDMCKRLGRAYTLRHNAQDSKPIYIN